MYLFFLMLLVILDGCVSSTSPPEPPPPTPPQYGQFTLDGYETGSYDIDHGIVIVDGEGNHTAFGIADNSAPMTILCDLNGISCGTYTEADSLFSFMVSPYILAYTAKQSTEEVIVFNLQPDSTSCSLTVTTFNDSLFEATFSGTLRALHDPSIILTVTGECRLPKLSSGE